MFAAQINIQRWRFFYGRMAILKRLKKLDIKVPCMSKTDKSNISEKVLAMSKLFSEMLNI